MGPGAGWLELAIGAPARSTRVRGSAQLSAFAARSVALRRAALDAINNQFSLAPERVGWALTANRSTPRMDRPLVYVCGLG